MTSARAKAWGGIDLGGTKIEALVADAHGKILGQARHPTPTEGGPRAIVHEMFQTLREAAQAGHLETAQLGGIGVGAPGAVNATTGTLLHAGNLNGWQKPFPLGAELSALAHAPVSLGNDVQVAVKAEYQLGIGRGHDSMLGVWWGTGVGGGIIIHGELWLGRGAAGEIGHTVVRRGGARCECGRRGCLEAYAGRAVMEKRARKAVQKGKKTALFQLMEERGRDHLTSSVWFRALEQKDPLATKLIDRAIKMLGAGIASAVNLLDVDAVVIGGGLGTRLGAEAVARIAEAMHPHLFVPDRPPEVHPATLGDLSGALGALLLVTPAHWELAAGEREKAEQPAAG